jgi:hypothetical protein
MIISVIHSEKEFRGVIKKELYVLKKNLEFNEEFPLDKLNDFIDGIINNNKLYYPMFIIMGVGILFYDDEIDFDYEHKILTTDELSNHLIELNR